MNQSIRFPIDKFTSKSDSILKGLPHAVIESINSMMIDKTFKKGKVFLLKALFQLVPSTRDQGRDGQEI